MSLLDKLKNIGTDGINALKEMRYFHNCGVCHHPMNTNQDPEAYHSSNLNGWYHRECMNTLDRCDSCDRSSLRLEHGICSRCMRSDSIRSYSYKPSPLFHRVNNKKKSVLVSDSGYSQHGLPILHFGVEIECDRHEDETEDYDNSIILEGNQFASLVSLIGRGVRKSNLFYSKSDGSLTEQGIEVVSHPFSWNFWKKYGREIYDTLFSTILSSGYFSAESFEGGMHIHVSKKAVNRTQLHKLLWFIYECPEFIKKIAQRDSMYGKTTWRSIIGSSYGDAPFRDRRKRVAKICKNKYSSVADRYTAVNLQPENTIEFRIFNGTLNIMTLSKGIEFIHSLLSYCSQSSFKDIVNRKSESVRVEGYLKFLSENQKRYTNLCVFLDTELLDYFNGLSKQKRNKYFGDSKSRLGRKLLTEGLSSNRNSNSFHEDVKGLIL